MSESPDEEASAPPLKKARYHWQVKNSKSRNRRCASEDENGNPSHSVENTLCNDNQSHLNNDENILSNSIDIDSDEDTLLEQNNNGSTEFKILNKVRKFVNGQTQQIVKTMVSETNDENIDCLGSVLVEPAINNNHLDETNNVSASTSNASNRLFSGPSETIPDISHNSDDQPEIPDVVNDRAAAPRLDYVSRWQSQQKAKAIVDNAINMTLEEMGLTPDLDHNLPILDRLHVEDESISEAIRRRGLFPQENEDQDALQGTITPLLHQLTQVSDRVFADRLNNMRLFITIRQTARNPDDGSETPLEWTDELAIRTLQSNSQGGSETLVNDDNPIPNQAFQLTLNSNQGPNQPPDGNVSVIDSSDNDFESDVDNYYDQSEIFGDSVLEDSNAHIEHVANDINVIDDNGHENIDTPLVQAELENELVDDSDLMNYAVNAAISAKGLAVPK
ncbi:hypothetical protein LOTGIDRAFT_228053 [Lottia gigantea]|uniref:Uncharacterized protein n=1 Tax=Lottia gigantea TaxID=225164 RepID=V4BHX0_LOTGI|nr:hypothetical protein LOTGIDRAFT_228053 [Lottia gigantea]ESP05482.1 hypothetical protein LOTGIDRAFT_228053 [Lottia gigantea]